MENAIPIKQKSHVAMSVIVFTLVIGILFTQFGLTFRGLFHQEAMDQAQIARNIAQGKGFTTQFIRPIELVDAADALKKRGAGELELDEFRDTNYAPLYPYVLAAALKITGQDSFEDTRMDEKEMSIYTPDRVIAGVSTFFFITSLILAFTLVRRLFDDYLAYVTVALMGLSDTLLNFATSGLPQPMMLTLLLIAAHFMLSAMNASYNDSGVFKRPLFLVLCFIAIGLLCLTSWMGIWVAIGMLIFAAINFRPYGVYAVPGMIVLLLMLVFPLIRDASVTGSLFGNMYYSLYISQMGGSDMVLRLADIGNLPLNTSGFWLRLMGNTFGQLNSLYSMMGTIIVVPFFFLSLFTRYKKNSTNSFKWAILLIWVTASVGMSLFGNSEDVSSSQLYVLLTPFFVAYGLSLVFMAISRLQLQHHFEMARNFSVFVLLLISSGGFLANLPTEIYQGIMHSGRPHFPPYYPSTLNTSFHDITNDKDIILSDQPWAVAWYANRKSMWTPLKVKEYREKLLPIIQRSGVEVQGVLVTPESFVMTDGADKTSGGLNGVMRNSGDFFPVVVEGLLCAQSPNGNMWYADIFAGSEASNGIGSLISSRGDFYQRLPLLGYHFIYYTNQDIKRPK